MKSEQNTHTHTHTSKLAEATGSWGCDLEPVARQIKDGR